MRAAAVPTCKPASSTARVQLCGRPICKITRFSSRPAIAQTTGARRPAPIIWRRFGPECLRRLRLSESSGVDRFLRAISKADPSVFESFPGVEQAVGGVLTDQNGRFVRYEVRINQDPQRVRIDRRGRVQGGLEGLGRERRAEPVLIGSRRSCTTKAAAAPSR